MTTLEKMARARCQRLQEQYKGYPFANLIAWENRPESERQELIECERAALEVLREPSEGMMHAAEHTPAMQFVVTALMQAKNHGMGELPEDSRIVGDVWATMIDTILEEDNDN